MPRSTVRASLALPILILLVASLAGAQTQIRPGWNLFSPEQDVQLGQEAVKEIEKEVEVVDDRQLASYVEGIGKRLVAVAPGAEYPYSFKVVADNSINAFALPGGPTYVHSGLIAAADNEAQLAGVMAHEVAHVALRHSTSQASKAKAFQIPLVLAGGLLGNKGGLLGTLAEVGVGFGLNSVFLKYSRDAEKQADLLGAQMMAEIGYDPVEMARFFEKLEGEGGSRMPQFFSDHPNPGNRVSYVQEEVNQLPRREYTTDATRNFSSMKARAAKIEPAQKPAEAAPAAAAAGPGQPTSAPSADARFEEFRGAGYQLAYPAGWHAYQVGNGTAVTIAPPDGILRQAGQSPALTLGLMAGFTDSPRGDLRSATDQLIRELQASNPKLQPVRGRREAVQVHGRTGEGVLLEGPSAVRGQSEFVWLVATQQPNGLFYLAFVSPDSRFSELREQYQSIVQSIRF